MILRFLPCVALLLATTASPSVGQVVEGPRGPVEFIGLQQWNATELLEAIQELAPNQPLHACAATMKSQLGFPEAAVFLYPESDDWYRSDDSRLYTVIVGVEDRARVRYRAPGSKTLDLPEPWQALKSVAEEDWGILVSAAEMFSGRHDSERVRERAELLGVDPTAFDRVWELIEALRHEPDHLLAHELLAHDASWSVRATAVSVLNHFDQHDRAWQALMSSLTDPDGRVSGLAGGVMRGLIDAGRARSVRVGPDPRTPEGAARRDQLVRVPDRAESTDRHRDRADVRDRADSGNAEPPARSRRRRARGDTGIRDPAPANPQWRGFRSGSGGLVGMVEQSPPSDAGRLIDSAITSRASWGVQYAILLGAS